MSIDSATLIEYAPIVVIIIVFMLKNKIFITPEQLHQTLSEKKTACQNECKEKYVNKTDLQLERRELLAESEKRYLSVAKFQEFEKRIEDRFNDHSRRFDNLDKNMIHIDEKLDNISSILLERE